MRKNLLFLGLLVLCIAQGVKAQTWNWVTEARPAILATELGSTMAIDAQQNTFIIGRFGSAVQVGTRTLQALGASDYYLAKYNPAGVLLFVRHLRISEGAKPDFKLVIDHAGNPLLMGSYTGTLTLEYESGATPIAITRQAGDLQSFVLKFTGTDGYPVWYRSGAAQGDKFTAIATDKAGSVYVARNTSNGGSLGLPTLVKYNDAGSLQWSHVVNSNTAVIQAIAVEGSNDLYLSGYYQGFIDFNQPNLRLEGPGDAFTAHFPYNQPGTPWIKGRHNNPNGYFNYASAAYMALTSTGPLVADDQGYLLRYSFDGSENWKRKPVQHIAGMAADKAGNLYVTGNFSAAQPIVLGDVSLTTPSNDAYIVKYNAAGDVVWGQKHNYTNNNGVWSHAIALASNGNVHIAGRVNNNARFGNIWVGNEQVPNTLYTGVLSQNQSSSVTVVYPNGGLAIPPNSVYNIVWKSDGVENVNIYLEIAGHFVPIANNLDANAGSYAWTVPDITSGARIKIQDANDPAIYDISDSDFAIWNPAKAIEVRSPDGWETLVAGSTHTIQWFYNSGAPVAIDYSTDNGTTWQAIVDSMANAGYYNWTVPAMSSNACRIRVRSLEDAVARDISDFIFKIIQQNQFTLISPNGDEVVREGQSYAITWENNPDVTRVNLLLRNSDGQLQTIATNVNASLERYDWTLPFNLTDKAEVIIESADNPAIADTSDNAFYILQVPELTVLSPNGGETLREGTSTTIRWQRNNPAIDRVNIRFLSYMGVSTPIASNVDAAAGQYYWALSYTFPIMGKVVIESTDNPSIADSSDKDVYINQVMTVISPNGGEMFARGTTQSIRWNYGDMPGKVTLFYSIDGGTNWNTIATAPTSQQYYNWSMPQVASANCKIRVVYNTTEADESDATFSILPPALKVTAPVKRAQWKESFTYIAKWEDFEANSKYNIGIAYDDRDPNSDGWNMRLLAKEIPGNANGVNQLSVTVPNDILDCYRDGKARVYVSRMSSLNTVQQTAYSDTITLFNPDPCDYLNNSNIAARMQEETTVADTRTGVSVYPNPASNTIAVWAEGITSESALIEIYSATGIKVRSLRMPVRSGSTQCNLDVSSLAPGIYNIRIVGTKAKGLSFIKK